MFEAGDVKKMVLGISDYFFCWSKEAESAVSWYTHTPGDKDMNSFDLLF
ncbi:hypothetical protein NEOC95_001861 [Neochlamydia sp. AcF95]|nr:hypothetical protein [Neochlamydia sp. AcF95]